MVQKSKRPYTRGNELFQLGACLYRMMSGQYVPDPEECRLCERRHWDPNSVPPPGVFVGCYPYFNIEDSCNDFTGYSSELVETLKDLLSNYRAGLNDWKSTAAGLLRVARQRYLIWKKDTPDGKLHRDQFDDEVRRHVNKEKKRAADSRQAHAQSVSGVIDISVRNGDEQE